MYKHSMIGLLCIVYFLTHLIRISRNMYVQYIVFYEFFTVLFDWCIC